MQQTFDVAVIGNGMMGSAATRYLSATGQRIVAIGPGEPEDWQSHQGVFASHYDQGRITRIIDPDPVWAHLAARSIEVYPEIEAQSGITFHQRSGGLRVSPDVTASIDTINQAELVGKEYGAIYSRLGAAELTQHFPFLLFAPGTTGLWERGGAGYINPRSLVRAQLTIAEQQGATIVRETVTGIVKRKDGVELTTDAGTQYSGAQSADRRWWLHQSSARTQAGSAPQSGDHAAGRAKRERGQTAAWIAHADLASG